jgi:cobalt-zinc-cadmium efflux system outer membrane protein
MKAYETPTVGKEPRDMNRFINRRSLTEYASITGRIRSAALLAVVLLTCAPGLAEEPTVLVNPAGLSSAPLEPLPPPTELPEVVEGLTLERLEELALTGNPTICRAYAMVGAARGNWVQVGLKPNPSVGYEGQQLGSGGLAEQHGVLFSQEIPTGGKLRLNRAVAQGEILVAEQELAAQRQRVLTDVRIAYYRVLVAQRQMELADELIRVSGEGSQSVDALFRAREVGRVDVLQAQLEGEQAQILLQDARNRYDAAWRSLAAILGNPTFPPQTIVGDPSGPPRGIEFEETLARLQSQSPEISAAVAELERARLAIDRARVQPIPNVTFQGLVNWQDNGIGGKPDGGVALSVPLPIFDKNQGAIMRAEREAAAARYAVSQVELDLQNRLAPVFEAFANARNQVSRYRDTILPAAEESLTLTRQMYQAGEANYLGLLTAQRTFAQTNRNYLDSVLQLRIAEVEIEGLLLSGSLQYRSGPGSMTGGATRAEIDSPRWELSPR